jgi:outer membrane protein assembly factor BamB
MTLPSSILLTFVRRASIMVALGGALAGSTHGENWPAWRGPRGDGVSTEKGLPVTWSEDHNVDWKTPIPGEGHSSPIVWEQSLFVTAAEAETEGRLLLRIDCESGEVLWQTPLLRSPTEPMHPGNSSASSTPATDGKLVVATFCDHGHYWVGACDFDGRLVWSRRLALFEAEHGFHSCPVICGDSVLLAGWQDGPQAFLARLDLATGETIWHTTLENPIRSYSPPFLFTNGDAPQVILSGADRTVGFDFAAGQQLWSIAGPAEKTVSSLVADRGLVFVAGGRDNQLLALRIPRADDPDTPEVVWNTTRGVPYVPSPVVYGGLLHLISDEGVYTSFDPQSGEMRSRSRIGGAVSGSPLAVEDRLYIPLEDGRMLVATADGELRTIALNDLGEPLRASPAASQGTLFLRGQHHLFCIRGE